MNRVRRACPLVAALGLIIMAAACTKNEEVTRPPGQPDGPPATTVGGTIGFPLPPDPGAAIGQARLPEYPTEQTSGDHYHAHLDIEIKGQKVVVPARIGMTEHGITPLHTHDDEVANPGASTGIVHIESEKKDEVYKLGQFFREWGLTLTKNCLADFCNDKTHQLLGYLNGQLVADPASIPFSPHAEIYLWYGPKGVNPKVAATYEFPAGL